MEEINKDDADEMEQAAEEGWLEAYSKDLPKAFAMRIRKWSGDLFSSKKGDVLAASPTKAARYLTRGERRISPSASEQK